tara:strand:+ start:350 stop:799 length:450 start_codon:yes stop_codon:yes gene_type:complete
MANPRKKAAGNIARRKAEKEGQAGSGRELRYDPFGRGRSLRGLSDRRRSMGVMDLTPSALKKFHSKEWDRPEGKHRERMRREFDMSNVDMFLAEQIGGGSGGLDDIEKLIKAGLVKQSLVPSAGAKERKEAAYNLAKKRRPADKPDRHH